MNAKVSNHAEKVGEQTAIDGQYSDLTVDWFNQVGTGLLLTMVCIPHTSYMNSPAPWNTTPIFPSSKSQGFFLALFCFLDCFFVFFEGIQHDSTDCPTSCLSSVSCMSKGNETTNLQNIITLAKIILHAICMVSYGVRSEEEN